MNATHDFDESLRGGHDHLTSITLPAGCTIKPPDADRAARLAGHKSLFRRLLERLRPHRQQPISDSEPQPSDP